MKYFFSILSFLLGGMSISNAQDISFLKYADTELKEVIQRLEHDSGLSFSYAEDVIKGKKITLELEGISLTELLGILEAQTGLHFEQLEEKQVIISPLSIEDEVCAFLLDKDTRRPIGDVSVVIDSSAVVLTDQKGFFKFDDVGNSNHQLSVSGYEPAYVYATDHCDPIYLTPKYSELNEVVVTAYITTGIDRNRDGSITLSQKPLGLLPGLTTPDILQSIQLIPGIISLDESASDIQIHGGTSDQNLVLFDNIRVFNTGYLYGMLSRFNPYATKKAAIFKTGTSAAFGDRISGVINITTDDELVKKTTGGIGFDGLSFDGFAKTPLSKKTALFLYARRSYSDVYQSPTYVGYAKKLFNNTGVTKDSNGDILNVTTDDDYTYDTSSNDFKFYDLNAKYIYQPTIKDRIAISALMTRNRTHFSFTNAGETKKDSLATGNGGVSARWTHQTGPKQTEEIVAYFSSYDSHYRNEEFLGETLEETNKRGNRISDFGLELKSDRILKNGNRLTFGYQLSNTNLEIEISKTSALESEDDFEQPVNESNLKNVLFGEYVLQKENSGLLNMGLRAVNYGSLGKLYLEPRLNMELPVSKSIRLRTSLERRNQPISQLIEFNQTELRLENNLWRLSDNLDYPLLQSNQIATGFLFDKNGWTLDAEGYYKRLKGLTTYSQGFSFPRPDLSDGESSVFGLDVLLKKRIGNYRFWLGYSYNDINFTFKDIQENSFPGNNDITHSFRISNSLNLKDFQFSLGWQYRTGEPVTPIESYDGQTRNVVFGPTNSDRLPTYHRLDASLTYQLNFKNEGLHLQFGVSALNLYNRTVPLSTIYRTMEENGELKLEQVIHRRSLGFTPNVMLRLFF